HPKVRRAVAEALGNVRAADAAAALIPVAQNDPSYLVRAAALHALGRTRDERAFDVLAAAVKEKSWNETVESGAVRGLAELADARAMPLALKAVRSKKGEGLRRAGTHAIGRIGELVESERTRAVQALEEILDDAVFLVALSAVATAESLGDARLLPALDRVAQSGRDARLRRDATEAAIRIRESGKVPAQVTGLRGDLDELREEQRKLAEKVEAIARH
ncbi:MAG TPA: HEAT repeat domain-containing protein, partial [Verrucomicrobiae bacterium]|nr:HEAT repeat domain-containing protein [Verrucomicrobiae bacterium]